MLALGTLTVRRHTRANFRNPQLGAADIQTAPCVSG